MSDRFGAVDGERLGIGDEAADRELEVPPLLDRTLGHHARTARLGADEERDRVQRCIAGDTDGRLDLCEAAPCSFRRVCREERRALLEIRHMRLVPGCPARAQLLQREHQLDGIEQADHACELRRSEAAREPDELGARHVYVDEHPGEHGVLDRHGLGRNLEVEPVRDDEAVDHVELGRSATVHAGDDAVHDDELGRRIVRPIRSHEAELGQWRHELLAVQLPLVARLETLATHGQAALDPHTPPRLRARTPPTS